MLRDGRTVRCGYDRSGIWVAVGEERAVVPPWSHGVGGLELAISSEERFAVLLVYSGQSSQGYELFRLDPLERLCGLPERRGHGSVPVFSPRANWVATLIDTERRLRDGGEYFEVAQDDTNDALVVVDWARLFVQRLATGQPESVAVGREIPLSTAVDDVLEWAPYDLVRFLDDDTIAIGDEYVVRLPLAGPLTSRASTRTH
jgi:hypothetical protein